MFAIAFDLDTNDTEDHHPKSVSQAYLDIRTTLQKHGFEWRQGSVYTSDNENLGNLFAAITASRPSPGSHCPSATSEPSA